MATAKKPAAAAKKPVAKAAAKTVAKPAVKAVAKTVAKAAPKAPAKTAAKPAAKTVAKVAPKKASTAVKKPAVKRTPNAAFMKPLTPSAALAEVVGAKPLPRTEVTKKVWEYIKKHRLQNAENKRNSEADDKLKVIFGGKKQVSMFEMTKLISGHLA